MVSAGMLIGVRTAASMLIGAIVELGDSGPLARTRRHPGQGRLRHRRHLAGLARGRDAGGEQLRSPPARVAVSGSFAARPRRAAPGPGQGARRRDPPPAAPAPVRAAAVRRRRHALRRGLGGVRPVADHGGRCAGARPHPRQCLGTLRRRDRPRTVGSRRHADPADFRGCGRGRAHHDLRRAGVDGNDVADRPDALGLQGRPAPGGVAPGPGERPGAGRNHRRGRVGPGLSGDRQELRHRQPDHAGLGGDIVEGDGRSGRWRVLQPALRRAARRADRRRPRQRPDAGVAARRLARAVMGALRPLRRLPSGWP